MTDREAIAREFEHQRRRAAATHAKAVRRVQLMPSQARALRIAADDGYPWIGHRSMAEIIREEDRQ